MDSTVRLPQPFQCALVTIDSAPLSLVTTAAMTQFKDGVKRSRHQIEIANAKAVIEILRRLCQIIWTCVRILLVSLLRWNTFSFYEIRQINYGSYPVAIMFESTPVQFELSAIYRMSLVVAGSGVLAVLALLFVKSALRRRVNEMKVDARRATKVVDAWSESAKRIDGGS